MGLPAETESGSRVGHEIPEDLRTKIINDTAVYAHSIAEARDRNADWAEDAVRDGVSVGAEEAVELDVVDLVAADRTELLARIDGMTVRLPDGEVTLGAAGALVVEEPMSPFEEFLMVLSDPNIALILLSLGTLGIYFELSSPGAFFPGIFGAIALILALFSLGTLPIQLRRAGAAPVRARVAGRRDLGGIRRGAGHRRRDRVRAGRPDPGR